MRWLALAAVLLLPTTAAADDAWLTDLAQARASAEGVIGGCKQAPDSCYADAAQERLAEAFVVCITWSEVVDGAAAAQDVANLHFLAPDRAAPWHTEEEQEAEPWLVSLVLRMPIVEDEPEAPTEDPKRTPTRGPDPDVVELALHGGVGVAGQDFGLGTETYADDPGVGIELLLLKVGGLRDAVPPLTIGLDIEARFGPDHATQTADPELGGFYPQVYASQRRGGSAAITVNARLGDLRRNEVLLGGGVQAGFDHVVAESYGGRTLGAVGGRFGVRGLHGLGKTQRFSLVWQARFDLLARDTLVAAGDGLLYVVQLGGFSAPIVTVTPGETDSTYVATSAYAEINIDHSLGLRVDLGASAFGEVTVGVGIPLDLGRGAGGVSFLGAARFGLRIGRVRQGRVNQATSASSPSRSDVDGA